MLMYCHQFQWGSDSAGLISISLALCFVIFYLSIFQEKIEQTYYSDLPIEMVDHAEQH